VHESQVQVLGFDFLKDLYKVDSYFQGDFDACKNPMNGDRVLWVEYILQDGLLFKNNKLCVPIFSMRESSIQENNNEGMVAHFGIDKKL